jgi:hypothetical protein
VGSSPDDEGSLANAELLSEGEGEAAGGLAGGDSQHLCTGQGNGGGLRIPTEDMQSLLWSRAFEKPTVRISLTATSIIVVGVIADEKRRHSERRWLWLPATKSHGP